MELDRKGVTRLVFKFKKYVVKIPNFTYEHSHFLQGCYANWSERKLTKNIKGCEGCIPSELLCPTLWCSWFGLIAIQPRVKPMDRDLTDEELSLYNGGNKEWFITNDIKKENFGYLNGKIVCVDYP